MIVTIAQAEIRSKSFGGSAKFVNFGGYQTPIYTARWWNINAQGLSDTDSFNAVTI